MTTLRPLILDDEAKQRVGRVVAYAKQPSHWYRPGDMQPPGNSPAHTVVLDSYRCVFSYTLSAENILYRHLSISIPSAHWPNPFAVWMIATLFEFTGWNERSIKMPKGWLAHLDNETHAVVVAQSIPLPEGHSENQNH
jgi:hypothetical protein